LYGQCRAGAQINFPESGRGLGHVTTRIFGSTVGYPSDSLASCSIPTPIPSKNFGLFPLDKIRDVGPADSEHYRLTKYEIIFEEFQHM